MNSSKQRLLFYLSLCGILFPLQSSCGPVKQNPLKYEAYDVVKGSYSALEKDEQAASGKVQTSDSQTEAPQKEAANQDDQLEADSMKPIPEILQFATQHHQGLIKWTPDEPLHKYWLHFNEWLHKLYQLDLGLAYTTLYQKASTSLLQSEAAGGDFDFYGLWTIADKKQTHPSSIGFMTEQRHKYTKIPPRDLGAAIGSLWGTCSTFNLQDYALVQLWWEYQFINNKLGFRIGKMDLTDYFNLYSFISSNYSFINEGLSSNLTIPFPSNGFGVIYGVRPFKQSLLLLTVADINARKTSMSPDAFFVKKEYFSAIEFRWVPEFCNLGKGRYNAMLWYADARKKLRLPSAWGFSFVLEQQIGKGLVPFVRFGYEDGKLTDTWMMISSGLGIVKPFKREDDQFALGFVWGRPNEKGKRDQFAAEIYYRLQLTPHLQVTPDIQLIINPTRNLKHGSIGVFCIRARFEG